MNTSDESMNKIQTQTRSRQRKGEGTETRTPDDEVRGSRRILTLSSMVLSLTDVALSHVQND
jgi:hypothetical protein